MTQDEIIDLAKQAGLLDEVNGWDVWFPDELEAFAKLVAAKHDPKIAIADAYRAGVDSGIAAEREACAKVCESQNEAGPDNENWWECAEAIRARGEK